jgi:hypothetical protein
MDHKKSIPVVQRRLHRTAPYHSQAEPRKPRPHVDDLRFWYSPSDASDAPGVVSQSQHLAHSA